jgi:uncharacterized protein DUF5615
LGTLFSELGPLVERTNGQPRVYADANIPTGVVAYMRERLGWDVLFVLEHDDLRRARDIEHYRLARQLGRTLITLDHDYLDDRGFPPDEGAGVMVFSAPDERWLRRLLKKMDRQLFRAEGARALPLERRKVEWHIGGLDHHDDDAGC